jgi:hypothetical protein
MVPYNPETNVPWFTEYDVDYILKHDISEQFGALSQVFLSKLDHVMAGGMHATGLSNEFLKAGIKSYEAWLAGQCRKARDAALSEPDGVKVLEACASEGLKTMLRGMEPIKPEDSNK